MPRYTLSPSSRLTERAFSAVEDYNDPMFLQQIALALSNRINKVERDFMYHATHRSNPHLNTLTGLGGSALTNLDGGASDAVFGAVTGIDGGDATTEF